MGATLEAVPWAAPGTEDAAFGEAGAVPLLKAGAVALESTLGATDAAGAEDSGAAGAEEAAAEDSGAAGAAGPELAGAGLAGAGVSAAEVGAAGLAGLSGSC